MKNKIIFFLFVFITIAFILSFGFYVFFLVNSKEPSRIFNCVKGSILEIKAETEDIGTSYGSAVIVSEDGTIVTNSHVITYKQLGKHYIFENISVRLINEEDFRRVSVIKYDIDLDLAVLKIQCDKKLSPITVRKNFKLNYGDKVYAIGNMSNYGISITSGIISIPELQLRLKVLNLFLLKISTN